MSYKKHFAALAACSILAVSTSVWAQAFTGAIFTTTSSGSTVNGNIYQQMTDVYLDGGPQNMNSSGLPDGTYYFQVTNPSGSLLLSTDPAICRELEVINGAVAGATGTCPHTNGSFNTTNGSTPVQLSPYNATDNAGGEYKVWLIPIADATIDLADDPTGATLTFDPSHSKTDNFKVLCASSGNCGTPPSGQPMITGFKWYDANTDGVFDNNEPIIPGWRIDATDQTTNFNFFTYTDANGNYSIPADSNNSYLITEIFPSSSWIVTACVAPPGPQSGGATVTCTSKTSATVSTGTTTNIAGPDFGNVCVGAGGGLTLGFWHNKNGQAILANDPGALAFLTGLNLVNANGSAFNPGTAAQLATWLTGATATNMANMLSAQLATMELNVREGDVSGTGFIYAPGVSGANSAGFISVNALMAAANTDLATHTVVLSGNSDRTNQQAMETALDSANNNMTFVQPGPSSCPFTTPY